MRYSVRYGGAEELCPIARGTEDVAAGERTKLILNFVPDISMSASGRVLTSIDRQQSARSGHTPRPFLPDRPLRMNRYMDELGEPHVHLAGLKLWVHGYQYRDADDYWDGNWLNATAICSENGATVLVRGAFIRTNEIYDWQQAIDKMLAELKGEAELACIEPEIGVTLKAQSLGAVEMEVQITPDQLTQEHRFTFAIDQSYLQPLSSQCVRMLNDFPIRGT